MWFAERLLIAAISQSSRTASWSWRWSGRGSVPSPPAAGRSARSCPSPRARDGPAGPGWSFAEVLPWFKRLENDADFGDEPWHGSSGAIPINRYLDIEPTAAGTAVQSALEASGFPSDSGLHRAAEIAPGGEHAVHFLTEFPIAFASAIQECGTFVGRDLQGGFEDLLHTLPLFTGHDSPPLIPADFPEGTAQPFDQPIP